MGSLSPVPFLAYRFKDAVSLYVRLRRLGVHPSTFELLATIKACGRISDRIMGTSIHAQVFKYGFDSNVYVQTSLVDLYSKLGDMRIAERVFDEMPERNVVSWNSLLSGRLKAGELVRAQRVFDEIPVKDMISWNSMILGYVKVGDMRLANSLFEKMPMRNSASWNGMICGYADYGDMVAARRFFERDVPKKQCVLDCDDCVGSAREIFYQMIEKDLACYAQNSQPKEALQLFNEILKPNVNVHPDEMTLASVISACSQLGDLRFGV